MDVQNEEILVVSSKQQISSFFFFISFYASFMSLGLYLISITMSSSDLILLSLACEDAFSSLNYDVMLSKELRNLCTIILLLVIVE